MNPKKNVVLFVLLILITLVIDQISKLIIVNSLTPFQDPVNVIGTFFRFKLTYNPYGVFSISFGPPILYFALSIIGIVILIYIGITARNQTNLIVFAIIIGGAFGNIVDRLRINCVVDFIDMGIGNLRWFTYNFADACITVGAIFLLAREMFGKRAPKETEQSGE